MGAPDEGWINQQVQQREYRVPVVSRVSEKTDNPQVKLILNIVELVGPGMTLFMLGLGAVVVVKKTLAKWFGEDRAK